MPTAGLPEKFKPIYDALVHGLALAAAVSLPLPDPTKMWCVGGMGLCVVSSVLSLPTMLKSNMVYLPPVLHFVGLTLAGLAFVNWAHQAFSQLPVAASAPLPVLSPVLQSTPTPVITVKTEPEADKTKA